MEMDLTFAMSFHSSLLSDMWINYELTGGSAVIRLCHLSVPGFMDCRRVPLSSNIHTPSYFLSQSDSGSHTSLTNFNGSHSTEIYGDFIFLKRG